MLRATNDKIIVHPKDKGVQEEAPVEGKLFLPKEVRKSIEGNKEYPQGKVISVGNLVKDVKVGDVISFSEHNDVFVKDSDGIRYISMRDTEVICIHE